MARSELARKRYKEEAMSSMVVMFDLSLID